MSKRGRELAAVIMGPEAAAAPSVGEEAVVAPSEEGEAVQQFGAQEESFHYVGLGSTQESRDEALVQHGKEKLTYKRRKFDEKARSQAACNDSVAQKATNTLYRSFGTAADTSTYADGPSGLKGASRYVLFHFIGVEKLNPDGGKKHTGKKSVEPLKPTL